MRIQTGIDRTLPLVGPMPPPPEDLSEGDWILLEAQVSLFGSEDVLAALQKHVTLRLAFANAVKDLNEIRETGAGGGAAGYRKVDEARQAVRARCIRCGGSCTTSSRRCQRS